MMAERQINYASIFGSYVMKKQYEIALARKTKEAEDTEHFNESVMQETVEDYIEQA